jgi:hypothetical protein
VIPRTVLFTRRLRLEPVAAGHAPGLYQAALASRVQLLPWMPWAAEITLDGNQDYTAEAERAWGWAMSSTSPSSKMIWSSA